MRYAAYIVGIIYNGLIDSNINVNSFFQSAQLWFFLIS